MHFLRMLVTALDSAGFSFFAGSVMKHFHSLSVSSAPADNTVVPSGDMARCRTRAV